MSAIQNEALFLVNELKDFGCSDAVLCNIAVNIISRIMEICSTHTEEYQQFIQSSLLGIGEFLIQGLVAGKAAMFTVLNFFFGLSNFFLFSVNFKSLKYSTFMMLDLR